MPLEIPKPERRKKIHQRPINPKLAAGVLFFLALILGAYLLANYKKIMLPQLMTGGMGGAKTAADKNQFRGEVLPKMVKFLSQDDFKSYLDNAKRSFDSDLFEKEVAADAETADQKNINGKSVAKNKISVDSANENDPARFFSMGRDDVAGIGDILQTSGSKIYFSPQNQFYIPAGAKTDLPAGETKIFDASDPAQTVQTGAIPQDGNFLISENALAVFLNNSLAVYDIADVTAAKELWRARLDSNSKIIGSQTFKNKLYLILAAAVDAAGPCPIKPINAGETPLIINCNEIYHPQVLAPVDTIYTILKMDIKNGKIEKSVSFAGKESSSNAIIGDNAIYAVWEQSREQSAFFADFLAQKCKGLLPTYILDKASLVPVMDISFAAKEFELRNLLANWFSALTMPEQERIGAEISNRMVDYLRDRAPEFEQTGIAKINLETLEFAVFAQVSGRLPDKTFIDWRGQNLRLITVSGNNAAQKINWLLTGKINPEEKQKALNNSYLLDANLEKIESSLAFDMPAGICGARFYDRGALAGVCRSGEALYLISFDKGAAGLQGKIELSKQGVYVYPRAGGKFLAITENNRKIKIELVDAAILARPEKIFEYPLNDYWADFDANWRAFAADGQSERFFLPAGRGGYVFSLLDGKIILEKNINSINASRAFFKEGNLYLAGDDGIEIFSAGDFAKIKSIKF